MQIGFLDEDGLRVAGDAPREGIGDAEACNEDTDCNKETLMNSDALLSASLYLIYTCMMNSLID